MSEDSEQLISEKTAMPTKFYPDLSASETQKMQSTLSPELQGIPERPQPLPSKDNEVSSAAPLLQGIPERPQPPVVHKKELQGIPERPQPLPQPPVVHKKASADNVLATKITKRDAEAVRMIQERCRQLCFPLFFREHTPVRSVGFTSSIEGEGKSFLSLATAQVLAHDTSEPVTLVECNWERPSLHKYFGVPATPGLAELLRGSCSEYDIRYQVENNLTIIPAGDGSQDSMKLLKPIQQVGLRNFFANKNGLFVVDLPPILTAGYGSLAASLLESVIIVVHAQITSDSMLTETYSLIKGLPVHGIILNQRESRIPRWIQRIL